MKADPGWSQAGAGHTDLLALSVPAWSAERDFIYRPIWISHQHQALFPGWQTTGNTADRPLLSDGQLGFGRIENIGHALRCRNATARNLYPSAELTLAQRDVVKIFTAASFAEPKIFLYFVEYPLQDTCQMH